MWKSSPYRLEHGIAFFMLVHTYTCTYTIHVIAVALSLKLITFAFFFVDQEKRSIFPRFYFIGDDDLLEILGQATNPVVIQSHLKKLFAGIHSVEFDDEQGRILAMKSLEGEVVPLKKPVNISNDVEVSVLLVSEGR